MLIFTETGKLFDANYRAKQQAHIDGISPLWLKTEPYYNVSTDAFVGLADAILRASLQLNTKLRSQTEIVPWPHEDL